jgi:hypothetical protein
MAHTPIDNTRISKKKAKLYRVGSIHERLTYTLLIKNEDRGKKRYVQKDEGEKKKEKGMREIQT